MRIGIVYAESAAVTLTQYSEFATRPENALLQSYVIVDPALISFVGMLHKYISATEENKHHL